MLLIAVAAAPAATQPRLSGLGLQTVEAGNLDNPVWARHDPVFGPEPSRRFVEEQAMPDWTVLFGVPAHDRDRRGLSFSMRPSHGLKARAKFRF
ncbi:MAG TPA: hypothetical protein VMN38_08895 [Sphingomicrobium sp.]|nr:hypothetical protein [Sphingomicrobium sp.]